MDNAQKQEIQAQFLEEAQDYLYAIESNLLAMEKSSQQDTLDRILKAAHSLKGGAAMMGFQDLSEIAHRLEDYFNILQGGRVSFNEQIEWLFLKCIDSLRQIIPRYRQGNIIDSSWLEQNIWPILHKLYQHFGDLRPEDEEAIFALKNQTDEADMSFFLFETEVESMLTEFEEMLANGDQTPSSLSPKLAEICLELGGLGEMLELSRFSQLCQSIEQCLQDNQEQIDLVMEVALRELRRSQALVLAKQTDLIPSQLTLENNSLPDISSKDNPDFTPAETNNDSLLELEVQEEEEMLDLFPSLETSPEIESWQEEIDEKTFVSPSLESSPEESSSPLLNKTIRVSARQIEELGDLFGELTIERNGLDLQIKNFRYILNYLRQKVRHLEKSNFQLRTLYDQIAVSSLKSAQLTNSFNSPLPPSESFDLLEMDRYNELHLVSGDMMETIVQIQEATNDFEIYLADTEKLNRQLSRTSKLMENNLTQVRMRPFSDLLINFPRALRDLEIQYDKRVELQTKGDSTLLEKSVLETLNDPLLHLLRNAFDHGIENTETRKKLGKPEVGTIKITAAYRGNQTIITISDDGKGINLAKIRDKVQKFGLNAKDIAQITEKELLDLIFEPGFTTSEQVTDLSGRGIGMNVVREAIEKIGGNIVVETKEGKGTTFILIVPFNLSVIRVFLVESNKMLLAFPSNAVEEVNVLDSNAIVKKDGKEFLNWQEEDNMLPLIRLNQYLKFAHSQPNFDSQTIPIINEPTLLMIEEENEIVALMVDRYWGEQEITIRPVEGNLKMPPGFSSCTILGDGRVVPLIDPLELLHWIDRQTDNSLNTSSDLPDNFVNSSEQKSIMVVDDSINVRRFLALTFSQENYHVEQAKDGQDALEKLQTSIPIQAIICDIEMPRLDGYGLLAHLKSNPELKDIPVVMLTSRSSDKHRKMAMNLGAIAYFSKPFVEKELVTFIENLLT